MHSAIFLPSKNIGAGAILIICSDDPIPLPATATAPCADREIGDFVAKILSCGLNLITSPVLVMRASSALLLIL